VILVEIVKIVVGFVVSWLLLLLMNRLLLWKVYCFWACCFVGRLKKIVVFVVESFVGLIVVGCCRDAVVIRLVVGIAVVGLLLLVVLVERFIVVVVGLVVGACCCWVVIVGSSCGKFFIIVGLVVGVGFGRNRNFK